MAKKKAYILPSPTEVLADLWEAGVFKQSRTSPEVIAELAKRDYNFSSSAVNMALSRAEFLTRKGSKGAYSYIQVGPYRRV